jgi:hypothetical protein
LDVRGVLSVVLGAALGAVAQAGPVGIIDAATRFAIDPARVSATAEGSGFIISVPGYRSRSFGAFPNDGIARFIVLEPEQVPAEIHPDTIALMHRRDATLIVGYVGDAATGRPLAGVSVSSGQGMAESDAGGYFQIYLPCRSDRDRGTLVFWKPGFQAQERADIELYPLGDYIYRIQLVRGDGRVRISDRPARLGVTAEPEVEGFSMANAAGSNVVSIPRVPTNIRVIDTNGVIYYETLENYCRHSLPSEWIASWANLTGGSNSLNAGAVAIRTYAVGYVNSPRGANHDICGWTACQVYNPAFTASQTTRAVDFTAGCVMVNANNAIPRGLTEYSAENNQLGMPCGDGYTAPTGGCLADPVCTGEPESGHGRGMCQWGSIRWASGLKIPGHNYDGSTNGQPRRDWQWILNHYYPNLRLIQGGPLGVDDPVRVIGGSTPLNVRSCPGGTITNGVNCPSVGTQPLGSLGYIIGGPERVTADGQGYTWWKVHWQNGVEGWSVENYLDRFIPTNTAPQITGVPDAIIHAGTTFRITNSATDTDFPPNTLTYLLPIRPIGASLNSTNGVLVWASPINSAGTTNHFTVRVTDDGSPPLSASTSFQVRVIPRPQLTAAVISPPSVRLTWSSAPQSRYRIYYTGSLSSPNWLPLGGILTSAGSTMTFTDNPGTTAQRFYRIVIVE